MALEKTPEFCVVRSTKGTPCGGVMPANERAKAPTPVNPPSAASTNRFWVVKLTVLSGTEAASDPEPPSTFKVPPENVVARKIDPYPASAVAVEMMISPEKPSFSSPVWGVELVTPTPTKVSKAGVAGTKTFPICVTSTGIEIEVIGVIWLEVNVAVSPENVALTKLMLSGWAKARMVPALAEVGRPSKAAHPKTRVHDKSRAKIGGLVKDPS